MLTPPHEGHGPRDAASSVPDRPPSSVRRTSNLDLSHPNGPAGHLVLNGASRDLRTSLDGSVTQLGTAEVEATVELSGSRSIVEMRSRPDLPGVSDLVGFPALSGFRARLSAAAPADAAARTPLHALLDDIPGAVVISGYAWVVGPPAGAPLLGHTPPADICSGWRSDGTMMLAIRRSGAMPRLSGPTAPPIIDAQDSIGWHAMPPLTPGQMRRRRLMDVAPDGDLLRVEAMFRDSYVDADGDESVVHEYGLAARVAVDGLTLVAVTAEPRVLPWQECPLAAASASALVGRQVGTLGQHVRGELSGTSSCTHLNDLLRTLDDVPTLAPELLTTG
ncbi:DUF2889 domain-containing protein [Trujillonella humicola]|uniref:DUF2889 domain-containing protein n=1 Tax=Trujillonella humicola TaxID=3383699 RepID=UPI0039061F0B